MIKKSLSLFSFIALLFIAVYLGSKFANNPGYVLFSYQNWSVEISLWLALLAILLLLFIFYIILKILSGAHSLVQNLRIWRLRCKTEKDRHLMNLINQGLSGLIGENWLLLKKLLPEIRKTKILSTEKFRAFECKLYSALLSEAFRAENFDEMVSLWKRLPKYLQNNPDFLVMYCDYLIKTNQLNKAKHLLKRALKNHANDSDLLLCLGRLINKY